MRYESTPLTRFHPIVTARSSAVTVTLVGTPTRTGGATMSVVDGGGAPEIGGGAGGTGGDGISIGLPHAVSDVSARSRADAAQ
ncbi:MAG: hypothetical protein A2638_00430 [Nitrospirae bacterium RIFCSPHIGHO2_01_FULL_66_17]|nr:MAG: hypothetical protein A2638_00430 [Nitrospirae bacterium RIFCSPHIGHO2_01_FULL_66_17]